MATLTWPDKDPDEVLDYAVDWTDAMAADDVADTIATASFTVPAGLTKDSETTTTTVATVWLSGGTVGSYSVVCEIVTAGGRTYQRTVKIKVKER